MAQEANNIVLEHLREIRADLHAVREDTREIKLRLSAVESHMAGFHTTVAVHGSELDQLKDRVARIEKRLDLRDG